MIANMTWYIARSSGIVAWLLLAGSVLWGLALSTKVLRGKPRPNWILDLHRFLGGIALVCVPRMARASPLVMGWPARRRRARPTAAVFVWRPKRSMMTCT